MFFLNRCVRNRSHGGVGAGGGQPPSATRLWDFLVAVTRPPGSPP